MPGNQKLKEDLINELIKQLSRVFIPDNTFLDIEYTKTIENDVTEFVNSQIAAMPFFLQLPYKITLFIFNLLSIPSYKKPFLMLDSKQKREYVSSWENNKISKIRDFIKPIRSCALLRYFDHPIVLRILESNVEALAHDL